MVRAKRPVLYVGGGVISVRRLAELRELAELTQIPVTHDPHGPGRLPDRRIRCRSTCSACTGPTTPTWPCTTPTCLIAVGARFDDRVTGRVDAFAPHAEIIHIDIDPSSISKNIKVDVPIVGDCTRVLRQLVEAVREELKDDVPRRGDGGAAGSGPRRSPSGSATHPAPLRLERRRHQAPVRDPGDLQPHPGRGVSIVTGVGQHQMWAAQYYRFKHPRHVVHLGRARHHGLRAAHRHGRAGRATRTSW